MAKNSNYRQNIVYMVLLSRTEVEIKKPGADRFMRLQFPKDLDENRFCHFSGFATQWTQH